MRIYTTMGGDEEGKPRLRRERSRENPLLSPPNSVRGGMRGNSGLVGKSGEEHI